MVLVNKNVLLSFENLELAIMNRVSQKAARKALFQMEHGARLVLFEQSANFNDCNYPHVSTVDRVYATQTQTLLHAIVVFQFLYGHTKISCTIHRRFSMHTLWIETGLESRVISTASLQKHEQSYSHLAKYMVAEPVR